MRLLGLSCDAQGVAVAAAEFELGSGPVTQLTCRAFVSMRQEGTSSASNLALGLIDEVLREFASTLQIGPYDPRQGLNLDVIAFNAGPGGFTAVRSACALAQGLALAWNTPLAAVSSLQAWAQSASQPITPPTSVATKPALVLLDARMSELYVGQFHMAGRALVAVEPLVLRPEQLIHEVKVIASKEKSKDATGVLLGDFSASFPALLPELEALGWTYQSHLKLEMYALLEVAYWEQQANSSFWVSAEQAAPIYVRNKVALDVREQQALRGARQTSA